VIKDKNEPHTRCHFFLGLSFIKKPKSMYWINTVHKKVKVNITISPLNKRIAGKETGNTSKKLRK
jgi:hypothetical protein